ncbi:MAG TPA: cytochrome C oxidase subunit IV family protein [Gemmatimonadales bacterium]|nr:cytochrome C oxidase subunit IV family protein [Gemmatimonadales bacterium]
MHNPMRYRSYWISWSALLALTVVMLATETVPMYHTIALALLLVAMVVKATVITAWFMHLRFERAALVVSVVGATVLTAVVLFGLIVPDGMAVLRHTTQ